MAAGGAAHQTVAAGDGGGGTDEWRVAVHPADVAEHENARGGGRQREWCEPALAPLLSWAAAPVRGVRSLAAAARDRAAGVARAAWRIGADDPRKLAHGFKMALALTLCSVFYYVQPLYAFTGHNAMWAVLTVVVVFEYTVGKRIVRLLSSKLCFPQPTQSTVTRKSSLKMDLSMHRRLLVQRAEQGHGDGDRRRAGPRRAVDGQQVRQGVGALHRQWISICFWCVRHPCRSTTNKHFH
jgi:hypothetical protein